MPKDNVRTLNQKVNLNLDELERESKEPFSAVIDGHRFTMKDPQEIDFKDLLSIEHPANFFKYALDDDAKKILAEATVPGWKFEALLKGYMEHYGLDAQSGKGWLS